MSSHSFQNFWVKWTNWEYWPAWLFNIPVLFMWLIQGLRNYNLLFFSRVNLDIETGGFFSEEKWPIYQLFPNNHVPLGKLIDPGYSDSQLHSIFEGAGFNYPVLIKPNIGERGMGIEKIKDRHALEDYHHRTSFDYIIQEYISFEKEMSVLAYHMPDEDHVHVTSVCLKEKLTISGDGKSTLSELATRDYRSRIQWDRLSKYFDGNRIPNAGEDLMLEPIGNHSRGTTFLNGNHLITEDFRKAIQQLFHSIDGEIYYGRFDIMFESIEDFIALRHFKIVEFNGVGSEPAHIYQPGYPLFKAYRCLWDHARILGNISLIQKHKGIACMTWKEFFAALRIYRSNIKKVLHAV